MRAIDPRFYIEADPSGEGDEFRIVKTSNGEAIPEDEPLMLFRARDHNALPMLRAYRAICENDGCTGFQMAGIGNRIEAFEQFAADHPERMKQPGITRGL